MYRRAELSGVLTGNELDTNRKCECIAGGSELNTDQKSWILTGSVNVAQSGSKLDYVIPDKRFRQQP